MAKKKRLKIVLDMNWYVSGYINQNSRSRLYDLLINEQRCQRYFHVIDVYRLFSDYKKRNKNETSSKKFRLILILNSM